MTLKEIIDGLKFTIDMFLFDPSTGETFTEPRNDMDKTTIDACKGAIELLDQTRWIPVETALPEEGVSVLVYAERNAYGDNGKYRKKVIDIGWQVDGKWHIDGCNGVVGIAWMPMPTPPNMSEIPTGVEVRENE